MCGHSFRSNLISIVSVVSCGFGAHFHLRMASIADWARTGWPPRIFGDFGKPFAPTTTSSLTVPTICILWANSGYSGDTRFTTFRWISTWFCWAKHHEHQSRVFRIMHAVRTPLVWLRTVGLLPPNIITALSDPNKVTLVSI